MDTAATTTTRSSLDETPSTRASLRRHGSSSNVEMVRLSSPSSLAISSHDSSSAPAARPTVWNSILAGYAAGISGTLVGHPFDSAKVWLQTQRSCKSTTTTTTLTNHAGATATATAATPASQTARNAASHTHLSTNNISRAVHTVSTGTLAASRSSSSSSSSAIAASTRLLSQQIRAFYAGVTGPLLTVGLVQSINFAIYDSVRRTLWQRQQQHDNGKIHSQQMYDRHHNNNNNNDYLYHDSLTNVAISSSVAGAVLAFFTSPMLIIKTQQQTVPGLTFQQALKQTMMRQRRRMFVGFAPHFLAETGGRAVYFCSYEALKRSFLVQQQQQAEYGDAFASSSSSATTTTCSLHQRMISAALSGILCWSLIFPLDALRCRMYAQQSVTSATNTTSSSSSSLSRNTVQMAQHMYQTGGGIKAFYHGFGVTVVRAGPVAAAVLPVYDWALEQLSSF